MTKMIKKHFVVFMSPGTLSSERTEEPIDKWDIDEAVQMSRKVKERHNATPYGFYFITRGRQDDELDSKQINASAMYYLGGKVQTYEEIRQHQPNSILESNMRYNNIKKVITNTNSWSITLPLEKGDVVLDYNN